MESKIHYAKIIEPTLINLNCFSIKFECSEINGNISSHVLSVIRNEEFGTVTINFANLNKELLTYLRNLNSNSYKSKVTVVVLDKEGNGIFKRVYDGLHPTKKILNDLFDNIGTNNTEPVISLNVDFTYDYYRDEIL